MTVNPNQVQIGFLFERALLGAPALGCLLACGGGGGDAAPVAPPPPVSTVIYNQIVGAQSDIYAVKADGAGTVALATGPEVERAVRVEGGRLIYQRQVAGQWDLFSVKLDGSGTAALASSPLSETVVGMAGTRLIYAHPSSDGVGVSFHSVNPDGTGHVLLHAHVQAWIGGAWASITGDQLVFTSASPVAGDIYTIHTDGTGFTPLAQGSGFEMPRMFSQGKLIYAEEGPGTDITLHTVNLDGSGHVPLNPTPGPITAVAAEAGRVVYRVQVNSAPLRNNLYSVRLDGTETRSLATNPTKDHVGDRIVGNRLIFESGNATTSEVHSVNLDGTDPLPLSPLYQNFHLAGVVGDHLVLIQGIPTDPATRLYSVSATGTAFTPLTSGVDLAGYEGFWNGRVYISLRIAGQADLFSCRVDGTERTALGVSPTEHEGHPMPAGDRVVYQLTSPSTGRSVGIRSVKPDGSAPAQLASGNCSLVIVY